MARYCHGQALAALADPMTIAKCVADLEGKRTGEIVGPITFGEIACMLLNQTLVYATIEDRPLAA